MNAKLKVFKGLEAEELERQVSTFLNREVYSVIKIRFNNVKVSKIVNMFEVEIDAYDCILMYVPR